MTTETHNDTPHDTEADSAPQSGEELLQAAPEEPVEEIQERSEQPQGEWAPREPVEATPSFWRKKSTKVGGAIAGLVTLVGGGVALSNSQSTNADPTIPRVTYSALPNQTSSPSVEPTLNTPSPTVAETTPVASESPTSPEESPSVEPTETAGEVDEALIAKLDKMDDMEFLKQPLKDQIAFGAARDKGINDGDVSVSEFFGDPKLAMTSSGETVSHYSAFYAPLGLDSDKDAIMHAAQFARTSAQSAAIDESLTGSNPIDHKKAAKLASYYALPGTNAYTQIISELEQMKTTATIPELEQEEAVSMEDTGKFQVTGTGEVFNHSRTIIEKRYNGTFKVVYVWVETPSVNRWLKVLDTANG